MFSNRIYFFGQLYILQQKYSNDLEFGPLKIFSQGCNCNILQRKNDPQIFNKQSVKKIKPIIDSCTSEKYILGYCVKKYKRIKICCSSFVSKKQCNICIGRTENGFYNIEKLIHTVKIDACKICDFCQNDNRAYNFERCKFCGVIR